MVFLTIELTSLDGYFLLSLLILNRLSPIISHLLSTFLLVYMGDCLINLIPLKS